MSRVLDDERPDLAVLTGDVISGAEAPDPALAWVMAVSPMAIRHLPWAAVFGNHDDEGALDRRALLDVQLGLDGCLTEAGPPEIGGGGNYVRPVFGHDDQPAALLYFLDSGSYSPTGAGDYAWIRHEQIDWYRRTSRDWRRGRERPLPALAFFHIPLPEYETAWREGYDRRGVRHEPVCSPVINSGMFAAFHECGDVVGIFVGHDHANDFEATLHGIRCVYGRATGYGGYGRRRFPRGARVIELREGEGELRTRVVLDGPPAR
jgi:hypothetical protein